MTMTNPPAVHLVRTIPASPARVYRAWLDPEIIRRWFAPAQYTVAAAEVDERVGGRHSIHQLDGGVDVGGFESRLLELIPDRRIVFAWGFVGPDRVPDPAHESLLTIELRPVGDDATELTLTHERLDGLRAALPVVAGAVTEGWNQAIIKLIAELSEDCA
jgi:uncharacterized protein YndB with AHSA1/START domain